MVCFCRNANEAWAWCVLCFREFGRKACHGTLFAHFVYGVIIHVNRATVYDGEVEGWSVIECTILCYCVDDGFDLGIG